MRKHTTPACVASTLALCLAAATLDALAATGSGGQTLTLTAAPDETSITVRYRAPDQFSPRQPCNQISYTMTVYNDGLLAANTSSYLQTGANGECFFERRLTAGAGYSLISPGVWSTTVSQNGGSAITENLAIYACTARQGKQPMYSVYHAQYTDHFYTTSAGDRDIALGIGYGYPRTPFAMPSPARFGSKPFYRYFKGSPELEHFYTLQPSEWQYLERNGYVYEGVEGYIFQNAKPGTVGLRRYSWYDRASGDQMHYYTINPSDPWAAGMYYDGTVGFVCTP